MAKGPMGDAYRTEEIAPVVAAARSGRRRRPSGEPPPLPWRLHKGTVVSLVLIGSAVVLSTTMRAEPVQRFVTSIDIAILTALEQLRTAGLTELLDGVTGIGSETVVRLVGWTTLFVLIVARRWRHLVVYLLVTLATTLLVTQFALVIGRPRPIGVAVLGEWEGYSFPSRPLATLTLVLVAAVIALAPAGRIRTSAAFFAAALIGVLGFARLYLAVDHPSDVLLGIVVGALVPFVVFRLFTPEETFPVIYRRPTGAHLELSPARHAALVRALDQQLGLTVESVELFGLAGSAGSTPMRLRVRTPDGRHIQVFAKLYAVTHLRSDRWYKLVRTILYGRLEDEKPFSTVRRLVEYEDHMLRLLRDAGLPTPAPYGFVEITPEREYLIVMEFIAGSQELLAAAVGEPEIDSGLRVVRKLWEAGVAHRDLKPSNLLVRDGSVLLIDVAFATVRPTPWRQAVDLANMMLCLALRSSAEKVYRRALLQFAADDIAEAFAATRSVTVPTQLRNQLRTDSRDLRAELRKLAPRREPVAIQLWSVRRIAVAATVALAALLVAGLIASYVRLVGLL